MKKILFASLFAAVGATPGFAADAVYVDPIIEAPAINYDWSGFYIGAYGGYAWGEFEADSVGGATHHLNDFDDPLDDASGGLLGGTVGYNAQMGNYVLGLEADLAWSGVDDQFVTSDPEWEAELEWLATVRPRLGYAFDRFLPYITGGLAVGSVDLSSFDNAAPPGGASDSQTHIGWTIGAGLEFAVTDRLSIKTEYNYVDLGEERYDLTDSDSFFGDEDLEFTANVVKFGLNYRF